MPELNAATAVGRDEVDAAHTHQTSTDKGHGGLLESTWPIRGEHVSLGSRDPPSSMSFLEAVYRDCWISSHETMAAIVVVPHERKGSHQESVLSNPVDEIPSVAAARRRQIRLKGVLDGISHHLDGPAFMPSGRSIKILPLSGENSPSARLVSRATKELHLPSCRRPRAPAGNHNRLGVRLNPGQTPVPLVLSLLRRPHQERTRASIDV